MIINEVEQEIANFQTGHAGGRLATADRILNKVRAATLREVVGWLEACSFWGKDKEDKHYRMIHPQDWQELKELE